MKDSPRQITVVVGLVSMGSRWGPWKWGCTAITGCYCTKVGTISGRGGEGSRVGVKATDEEHAVKGGGWALGSHASWILQCYCSIRTCHQECLGFRVWGRNDDDDKREGLARSAAMSLQAPLVARPSLPLALLGAIMFFALLAPRQSVLPALANSLAILVNINLLHKPNVT